MDCAKIGHLIHELRQEKGLTQQQIAEALNVSNKTISKWECGLGCPDTGLWPELSVILGVDMKQLMEGEITQNRPDGGNMDKVRFYVCPSCKNVMVSTGSASIVCCGRKVKQEAPVKGSEFPEINVEENDLDYYITIDHEMSREHYLLFAAYVRSDKIFLNRLYPEQTAAVRVPYLPGGKLYLYCVKHGLTARVLPRAK